MFKMPKFLQMKSLVVVFQSLLFSLVAQEEIRIEVARGPEIARYTKDLVRLSDAFYSQYPYLFDGVQSDEEFYLRLYARKPDGWLAIAFDGDCAIGYAIGAPMNDIPIGQEPLLKNGYSPDSLYLLGEITLLEPYRGQRLGTKMVRQMERFAKGLGYKTLCLTQIDEASVLMPRPSTYRSSDDFWRELGFKPYENLSFYINWRNVNEPQESLHSMFFWMKPL